MPDDLPRARRIRPRDEEGDDSTPPRRRPPVGLIVAGAAAAGMLILFGIVAVVGLAGFRAVREERRQAERSAAEAHAAHDEAERKGRGVAEKQPAKEAEAKPVAKATPGARLYDGDAVNELMTAFQDNPAEAKRKYAAVRWLFKDMSVDSFVGDRTVEVRRAASESTRTFTVTFRPKDAAALRTSKPVTFDAVCEDYTLVGNVWSIRFRDAAVVEPTPSP